MAEAVVIGASLQVALQFTLEKIAKLISQEVALHRGLKGDLKKLNKSLLLHRKFLDQAESQQVVDYDGSLQFWFQKFEDAVTEAENVLERIEHEYHHRKNIGARDLKYFFQSIPSFVAREVKNINAELEKLHEQGTRFRFEQSAAVKSGSDATGIAGKWESDSVADDDDKMVARDDVDVGALVEKINNLGDDKQVYVIPIVGMGGIGKTTLAKSLFNHQKIEQKFPKRIWVWLSENSGPKKILASMLESLTQVNHQLQSRDAIVGKLRVAIEKERFFLVLDNMWDEFMTTIWEELERSLKGISPLKGHCIVITTRDAKVAVGVGKPSDTLLLHKLSDDHCWSILQKRAFPGLAVTEEVEAIGKEIAKKCQGIPLAASIIGRMLRNKEAEEWQSILDEGLKDLLEDPESRLMAILRLSFDRLPSVWLRKCFAYCSVLKKGSRIEREKLIQLWMAEGLLQDNPQSGKAKQEIGNDFFNKLLQRGLFQDAQRDEYGSHVLHCRMHDFVHRLACLVSGRKTARGREHQISDEVRYLVLDCAQELQVYKTMVKNTRTLFWETNLFSGKILESFPFLRVLKLCSQAVKELPKEIGDVIHLRCLDISETEIVELPKSICRLYLLETLIAKTSLRFPDKFKNLHNLRVLDYFTKECAAEMPPEIGQLTNLQKLLFFNVGKEKGRRIEELGPLKSLRGCLEIRNLELINGKEEANSSNLFQKSNLLNLKLEWSSSHPADKDNEVLEGLQPHTNLKGLEIQNFSGNQLPSSWISRLEKLIKLEIKSCRQCTAMTSLAHLPQLRYLKLERMDELERWDDDPATMSSKPFRKLEELTLCHCPRLSTSPSDFPSLKKLEMRFVKQEVVTFICGRVKTLTILTIVVVEQLTHLPSSLPTNNKSLASITLSGCPQLIEIVPEIGSLSSSLEELRVQACPELTHLPHDLYALVALQKIEIQGCSKLTSFPSSTENQSLKSLKFFSVCDCESLTEFPEQIIQTCESLQLLWISNCQEVTTFEVDFHQTPSLRWLSLSNCKKLTSIPKGLERLTCLKTLWIGPFSETVEFDSLNPMFESIQHLSTTLHDLQLFGWPHWNSLPQQLQHLQRLIQLCLHGFWIQELPDWFGNFTLLQNLEFHGCERLQKLASAQSMNRLTNLRELLHRNCSLLEQKLERETGPDSERSKIPNVKVSVLTITIVDPNL